MILVYIVEKVYLTNSKKCKYHLYGCILLIKGNKPLMHLVLCKKFDVWVNGKRFLTIKDFIIIFSLLENIRRILVIALWNFSPRILRVFIWTKDFVSTSIKFTKTQSWVCIHDFLLEYWQSKTIFSIARDIGKFLSLDD